MLASTSPTTSQMTSNIFSDVLEYFLLERSQSPCPSRLLSSVAPRTTQFLFAYWVWKHLLSKITPLNAFRRFSPEMFLVKRFRCLSAILYTKCPASSILVPDACLVVLLDILRCSRIVFANTLSRMSLPVLDVFRCGFWMSLNAIESSVSCFMLLIIPFRGKS